MALHIEDPEADRLAHELSDELGQTVDAAVVAALRRELERARCAPRVARLSREEIFRRVDEVVARVAAMPDVEHADPDDFLYDEYGAPR